MKKLTKGDQTKEHLYRCALALFRDKGYVYKCKNKSFLK